MGQREIQPFDKLPGTMPGTGRTGGQGAAGRGQKATRN